MSDVKALVELASYYEKTEEAYEEALSDVSMYEHKLASAKSQVAHQKERLRDLEKRILAGSRGND